MGANLEKIVFSRLVVEGPPLCRIRWRALRVSCVVKSFRLAATLEVTRTGHAQLLTCREKSYLCQKIRTMRNTMLAGIEMMSEKLRTFSQKRPCLGT